MYYRIKLQRVENDTIWNVPGYFRKKSNAVKRATFWDSFYGNRYDGISVRIWKAKVIQSKNRPKNQRRLT